jgi:hypothetical protein
VDGEPQTLDVIIVNDFVGKQCLIIKNAVLLSLNRAESPVFCQSQQIDKIKFVFSRLIAPPAAPHRIWNRSLRVVELLSPTALLSLLTNHHPRYSWLLRLSLEAPFLAQPRPESVGLITHY